ncbi:hypothetical protein JHK85_043677 [Glycine max]|nr:hypothetical protein JHK85_043677 [Glycine max]
MAAANAPIAMREALTLPSIDINPQFITFTHVTMESDKYICVRETAPQNSVVIIDMNMPNQPLRRPITADSALMNPNSRILALKETIKIYGPWSSAWVGEAGGAYNSGGNHVSNRFLNNFCAVLWHRLMGKKILAVSSDVHIKDFYIQLENVSRS